MQLKQFPWIEELKEKRQAYGVSQNKLAIASGISREYLNKIENHKVDVDSKLKELILQKLEYFNPDNPLEMLFD